jgi:hypothetical protein
MFDGEIQGYQSEGGASEFSKLTDDEYFGGYFPEEDGMTGGALQTGVLDGDNSLKNLINTFNPFIIMGIHDNEDELQIKYKEKILKIVNNKLKQIDRTRDRDSDSGIGKKVPYFFALINDIIVSSLIFLKTTFFDKYTKLINFKNNTNTVSVAVEEAKGDYENETENIIEFLSKYKNYLINSSPENSEVPGTINDLIAQINSYSETNLEQNDIEELVEEIKENPFKKEKEEEEEKKEEQQQPSNLKKLMIAKINGLLNHVEGTDNPVHQQPANGDDNGDPDPVQSNRGPNSDYKTPSQSPSASTGNASSGSQKTDRNLLLDLDPNNEDPSRSPSASTGNTSSGSQQKPSTQQQAQSTASTSRANEEERVNDDSSNREDDDEDEDEDDTDDDEPDFENVLPKKVSEKNIERARARKRTREQREAKRAAARAAREAKAAREVAQPEEPVRPSEALNELAEAENTSTTTAPEGVEPFSELVNSDLNK